MIPLSELRTWTRQFGDTSYTCSTDPRLVQLDALNAAFESDIVYWAKALPVETLRRCVDHSLCFALYVNEGGREGGGSNGVDGKEDGEKQQQEEAVDAATPGPMIGFGRLVTDHVTFGYLTDVYVLSAHQGRGLARWMMGCVGEMLDGWPELRRCLLLTRDAAAVRLYRDTIGARDVRETSTSKLFICERPGTTVKVLVGEEGINGTGKGEAGGEGTNA